MDIKHARDSLLDTLTDIDKEKLNLQELKTYAEIMKTISEIQVKTFAEYMTEVQQNICCSSAFNSPKIYEMKGEATNG